MSTEPSSSQATARGGGRIARITRGDIFPLRDHPLSSNDLRQCLRAATAATLGFIICKLFDLNYGVFFCVYPLLLTALVPVLTAHVARQIVVSSLVNSVEVALIAGFFSHMPVVMTAVVFVLFYVRFRLMSRGILFLFGAMSIVCLSVTFHFASYPSTDLHDLLASNMAACSLSVILSLFATWLFPDVEPRQPPPAVTKPLSRIRHESLLGTSCATLSFVVFQVFDLQDSLSAQVATVLILFPMHFDGVKVAARWRMTGIILGCSYGLVAQLVVYDAFNKLVLVIPLLWIGLMLAARIHATEKVGSGVGFGCMTTIAILFGQYLQPDQDLIYSDLYRITSVAFALSVTVVVAWLIHHFLNLFPGTRMIVE
ncbi:DUF2955 domain-containing protein [Carnimonas nigrificans]|uniref:DUF2955 domain-containing protein n=1 Tax=Carnimonas nigrificans TaxID=64323 RepID=UPI0004BB7E1A|nr:DUF2955 domain-containing protein [Carnimonas nigrificans]